MADGAELLLAASASPWVAGKSARQIKRVCQVARDSGVEVVSVNQAGANDDLIFGGDVIHAGPEGQQRPARFPFCGLHDELVVQMGGPIAEAGHALSRPFGSPTRPS